MIIAEYKLCFCVHLAMSSCFDLYFVIIYDQHNRLADIMSAFTEISGFWQLDNGYE